MTYVEWKCLTFVKPDQVHFCCTENEKYCGQKKQMLKNLKLTLGKHLLCVKNAVNLYSKPFCKTNQCSQLLL